MKRRFQSSSIYLILLSLFVGSLMAASADATPLTTAFTYQGKLEQGGNPANGTSTSDLICWTRPIP